jgi:hypothetical protein
MLKFLFKVLHLKFKFCICRCGGMVDTRHLKCRGRKPVPVQVRPAVIQTGVTLHIWRSGRSHWPHKPIPSGHRRFESCFMQIFKHQKTLKGDL